MDEVNKDQKRDDENERIDRDQLDFQFYDLSDKPPVCLPETQTNETVEKSSPKEALQAFETQKITEDISKLIDLVGRYGEDWAQEFRNSYNNFLKDTNGMEDQMTREKLRGILENALLYRFKPPDDNLQKSFEFNLPATVEAIMIEDASRLLKLSREIIHLCSPYNPKEGDLRFKELDEFEKRNIKNVKNIIIPNISHELLNQHRIGLATMFSKLKCLIKIREEITSPIDNYYSCFNIRKLERVQLTAETQRIRNFFRNIVAFPAPNYILEDPRWDNMEERREAARRITKVLDVCHGVLIICQKYSPTQAQKCLDNLANFQEMNPECGFAPNWENMFLFHHIDQCIKLLNA
ncbi:DgyrCDS744 [Dimorphilus gyrociliatus]|uniref:DgyrCDS744 n=1 Tax=Dimorphilus gyrociliatus TaxID=2664684 RepID=A0A7I8V835_9ANNE|nr:DgyrCDS744 [Dimorphilus gyrociliatus]